MHPAQYLRRKEAGEYLKSKFGFGSAKTLAKLACLGGGPEMVYAGAIPLYSFAALDAWVASKLTAPVRNTSEPRQPAAVS